MKKSQRALVGFAATCTCFFVIMLAGSFAKPNTDITASGKDLISERSEEDLTSETSSASSEVPVSPETFTPLPTETPTASPSPTLSPTPTVSPTPTLTPTPTLSPTPTISPTPVPKAYVPNFTIPAVTSNLNIRKGPGTTNDLIGKLPADSYAIILGESNGWTKISTGSISEGYVSSEYLFTPAEVASISDREKLVTATITTDVLNVRSGPGTWYDAIDKVTSGSSYSVYLGKSYDNWIAIELKNGTIGYVSEKYITLTVKMDTGMTLAEIEEKEHQNAIAQAMARAQIFHVEESIRQPVTMTDDELYLFATVIYTEAWGEGHEGMLAVANVILNRMEYGHWGTTLEEVLFAPGQFAGARQELLDRAQARGIPEACYDAAREALAGRNNIGDFLFFRTTDSAMKASDYLYYTTFYILNGHVFYWKNW